MSQQGVSTLAQNEIYSIMGEPLRKRCDYHGFLNCGVISVADKVLVMQEGCKKGIVDRADLTQEQ